MITNENQGRRVAIVPVINGRATLQTSHLFLGFYNEDTGAVNEWNGTGELARNKAENLIKGLNADLFPYISLKEFRTPQEYQFPFQNRVEIQPTVETVVMNGTPGLYADYSELTYNVSSNYTVYPSPIEIEESGFAGGRAYTRIHKATVAGIQDQSLAFDNFYTFNDGITKMLDGAPTFKFYDLQGGSLVEFKHLVVLEHYIK